MKTTKNEEKPVVRDEVTVQQQKEDDLDTDAWKEMNNEEKILRIYKVRADRSGGELVHRCLVETPADVEQIMDEIGERIGGTLKGEVRCRPSMRLVVRGLYRSYGAVKNEPVVQKDESKSEIIAILQMLQQKADADRERDRIDRLEREERERIAREKADERFQMLMKAQSDTAAQFAAMVSQAQSKNVEILMNMISTMNTNKADPVETLIKLRTLEKSGGGISDVIEPVMSILTMGMKLGEGQPIKEPDGMERILNILDKGLQVVANTTQKNRMLPQRQSATQAIPQKTQTEQTAEEDAKMVAQPTNDLERFLIRHRGTLGQAIRSDVASEYEKAVGLLQMIGADPSISITPTQAKEMLSGITAQRIAELIPLAKGYETVVETIRQECIGVLEQTIAEAEGTDEGTDNGEEKKNKS
jgi:hypothetical protein